MQILRSANIPWLVSFYLDRMSHVISILTPFLIFMVVSIISQESVFVKSDPVRACLLPAIFFLFKPGQALCWCHMTYISAIIYYSIWYAGGNKKTNYKSALYIVEIALIELYIMITCTRIRYIIGQEYASSIDLHFIFQHTFFWGICCNLLPFAVHSFICKYKIVIVRQ